jgi:hypothetical protein
MKPGVPDQVTRVPFQELSHTQYIARTRDQDRVFRLLNIEFPARDVRMREAGAAPATGAVTTGPPVKRAFDDNYPVPAWKKIWQCSAWLSGTAGKMPEMEINPCQAR